MFLFLLLSSTSAFDTVNCRSLENWSNITSPDCISIVHDAIEIYTCTPGYFCNTTILNNNETITDPVECLPLNRSYRCTGMGDLSEGRQCCTNTDCKSGNCYNLICTGITPCVADEDCIRDQYCDTNSGNCIGAIHDGDVCSHDNQCHVGSGCNFQTCTQLLSLDTGSYVESPKFCMTNFSYNNVCDYISVYVNRTFQSMPYSCFTPKDMCNYTLAYAKVNVSYSSCICSGINDTLGYCSEYVIYDYDYSVNLYRNLSYNSSNCGGQWKNTIDPDILLECGSIGNENYYQFLKGYYRALYWNLYAANLLDDYAVTLGLYDPTWTFGRELTVLLVWTALGFLT